MRSLRTVTLLTAAAALVGSALVNGSPASAAPSQPQSVAPAAVSSQGQFTAVGPSRILDTRSGSPVGAARTINLAVAGHGGVPAAGASSVVFNLTVVSPTAAGHVTVYPTGQTRPNSSNINFPRGWVGANLVTVALGSGGSVSLYNSSGSVDLLVDVVGWYADGSGSAHGVGQFQEVTPTRLVDTRIKKTPLAAGGTLTDPMTFTSGTSTADPHVKAVAVTITVVHPQTSGHITAWSGSGAAPTASILNFTKGAIVPNLAIVPVAPCAKCSGSSLNLPSITLANGSGGSVDILIDIWGFFDDAQLGNGLDFKSMSPTRILDTRPGGVGGLSSFPGNTAKTVSNTGAVADLDTAMLVQNVTAITAESTYLTLYPTGGTRPTVSNLNPPGGRTVAGLAITGVDGSNRFNVFSAGPSDVIIDVAGAFESGTPAVPSVAGAVTPQAASAARPAGAAWTAVSAAAVQR